MVIFHSYVSLPEGILKYPANQNPGGLSPGLQSIHFGAPSVGSFDRGAMVQNIG